MRRSAGRYTIVLIAALPACTGRPGGGTFEGTVSRSQFFEYHDRVEEPLCPTLLSMLDQHVQLIGGKIGLRVDPEDPIAYYKFRDDADIEANGSCPETSGCAGANAVYSSRFFHAHELAHAYTFRAWGGYPTGLVAEGEAVALSCDPGYDVPPGYRPRDVLGDPNWRDLLYLYGNSREGYSAAGYWVSYLAGHYGWDRVGQLHQRALPGIAPADFEREFARVFPTSMDEAWSAALDSPDALPCQDDWRCMSTPLALGDHAMPACDGETHRAVTVTDQPGVALTLGGSYGEVILRNCADPSPAIYDLSGGPTDRATHFAELAPGTYTLLPGYAFTDAELAAYLPSGFDADGCAGASRITLDPGQASTIDLLPGHSNGWISLAGGGHGFLVGSIGVDWMGWPNADGGPAICDGCDATATCVAVPYAEQTLVTIGDGAVLRLVGVSAVTGSNPYGQIVFWPPPASPAP